MCNLFFTIDQARDYDRQMLNHINKSVPLKFDEAQVMQDSIKELIAKYSKIAQEIISLPAYASIPEGNSLLPKRMRQDRQESNQMLAGAIRIKRKLSITVDSPVGNAGGFSGGNPPASASVNDLPKLQISKFNGNWHEWLSFRDMFKASVYDPPDAQLAPIKKLQYLKQALEGDALRTIQSIPMTDASLKRAWDALLEKYDNKSKMVKDYLEDIQNLKPIHEPSAYKLRQLFDKVNENREALSILGQNVEHWDSILVNSVCKVF